MTNNDTTATTTDQQRAATIAARYEGLKFEAPLRAPRRTGKVRTARHSRRRAIR